VADEFGEVRRYLQKLDDTLSSPATAKRLQRAGSKEATDAARHVGRARRLHNWHGSKLDAREVDDGAALAGPWRLFEEGRRSSGEIQPRSAQAVLTPEGPRANSSYGSSSGIGVYTDASELARRTVPKAVYEEWQVQVRRAVN
jgi:hypothetical protein